MANLKQLTNEYTSPDGALVFDMLPYRNIATSILNSDMRGVFTADKWLPDMYAFCLLMGVTQGIQLLDTSNVEAQGLITFWQQSQDTPSTVDKWKAFRNLLSEDMITVWWTAYESTRKKVIPAPEVLQMGEPTDPNSSGSGGMLIVENS